MYDKMVETSKLMTPPIKTVLQRSIADLGRTSSVVKCGPDATLAEVLKLLQSSKVGSVIVTEGLKVIGIMTERDFIMRVALKPIDCQKEKVRDYMTKNPICLQRHTTLGDILSQMQQGKFRHIIIVDAYQNLESVVSIRDITEYLVSVVSKLDESPSKVAA